MLELHRRGAVHVIAVSLIFAALAPHATAATPPDAATEHLLAAVEATTVSTAAGRGTTSNRSMVTLTAATTAATAGVVPSGAERFRSTGVDGPPNVTMSATLVTNPVVAPVQWVAAPGAAPTISGTASWYCCTMGWGDAAVAALPVALGGHYYPPPGGGWVTVCADRCARIPIGDACACNWGLPGQKVIDLSPAAWSAITDKDRWVYGIVSVTVYLD